MLDGGEALSLLPCAGDGFTGHPALIAHRNGMELITQFAVTGCAPTDNGLDIHLSDALASVSATLQIRMDDATGVISARTSLVNLDDRLLTVDWLAACAIPSAHAELLIHGGRWSGEFQSSRQTLTTGQFVQENRTGRTSHHAPPFLVAGKPGFTQGRGETIALHIAWSGNHRILAERLRDGRIQLQAGELLGPGEIVLGHGETYATPWVYIARSDSGLNGLSDRLHPFVRARIMANRLAAKPRPVHYNTWEAVYFDHRPDTLMQLADLAASVGAERYVLDDGWFRGRNDDHTSLGDWTVDPDKYPDGLGPLIAHVRRLGMEFGLWVEPEMANLDSDLLRAHPDWILGAPGRTQPLGRNQYVLDLTRAEVSDAIFAQLDALLAQNDIAYLKWDMNRDLTHAVSDGHGAVHRQTLAVYALIDRLKASHPHVEIESCASGGGRADYEILKRTDRIWASDCNDPIERQKIQRGFSIFMPPEIMGSHVGPEASHTTARTASLGFRALTSITGHMGIEADLRGFTAEQRDELARYIALYKELRATLHAGRTIRLDHPDPGMMAQALGGSDSWLVTAAQIDTPHTAMLAPLRIPGLDPHAIYTVRLINPPQRGWASMKRRTPFIRGESLSATGLMLAHAGIELPVLRAGEIAAILIILEQAS